MMLEKINEIKTPYCFICGVEVHHYDDFIKHIQETRHKLYIMELKPKSYQSFSIIDKAKGAL